MLEKIRSYGFPLGYLKVHLICKKIDPETGKFVANSLKYSFCNHLKTPEAIKKLNFEKKMKRKQFRAEGSYD